ncbi:MAG: 30S ribosomal protein S8 [Legionellales bacterium]|nr:30S ribosomal protein S8 [Legionellales bacterium]|tara:strand:- start:562 stop:963 length:402 start_codon:yes stop_codon:yes gene_type:complete
MSDQDPISTMLTVIRNGQMAKKKQVTFKHSTVKISILSVLKEEGYIRAYTVSDIGNNKSTINVALKYTEDNQPVIQSIDRISRPGLRVYKKHDQLPRVKDGLGIAIVSTSKGVMTAYDAKKQDLGGEILCQVT